MASSSVSFLLLFFAWFLDVYTLGDDVSRSIYSDPIIGDYVPKPCWKFRTKNGRRISSDTITSPNYPNAYPNGTTCLQVLEAPEGHIIHVTFRGKFHIEASPTCKYDFIELHDGQFGFSPTIGRWCGKDYPPSIATKTRFLLILFRVDDNVQYDGFKFTYNFELRPDIVTTSKLSECYFKLKMEDKLQTEINLDAIPESRRDIPPLDCTWEIEGRTGKRFMLNLLEFALPASNNCSANFVEVYDRTSLGGDQARRYCSQVLSVFHSGSNRIFIRFFLRDVMLLEKVSLVALISIFHTGPCDPTVAFRCGDNTCIDHSLVCNQVINCKYNWDEDDECLARSSASGQGGLAAALSPSSVPVHAVILSALAASIVVAVCISMTMTCRSKWQRRSAVNKAQDSSFLPQDSSFLPPYPASVCNEIADKRGSEKERSIDVEMKSTTLDGRHKFSATEKGKEAFEKHEYAKVDSGGDVPNQALMTSMMTSTTMNAGSDACCPSHNMGCHVRDQMASRGRHGCCHGCCHCSHAAPRLPMVKTQSQRNPQRNPHRCEKHNVNVNEEPRTSQKLNRAKEIPSAGNRSHSTDPHLSEVIYDQVHEDFTFRRFQTVADDIYAEGDSQALPRVRSHLRPSVTEMTILDDVLAMSPLATWGGGSAASLPLALPSLASDDSDDGGMASLLQLREGWNKDISGLEALEVDAPHVFTSVALITSPPTDAGATDTPPHVTPHVAPECVAPKHAMPPHFSTLPHQSSLKRDKLHPGGHYALGTMATNDDLAMVDPLIIMTSLTSNTLPRAKSFHGAIGQNSVRFNTEPDIIEPPSPPHSSSPSHPLPSSVTYLPSIVPIVTKSIFKSTQSLNRHYGMPKV